MKKIHYVAIVMILLLALPLSAQSRGGSFSFSMAPCDPLFKESRSNTFSNVTTFHYMFAKHDVKYLPTTFLVVDETMNGGNGGYKELPFDDPDPSHSGFWHLKAADNIGLIRFGWPDYLKAELYLHGGLNTIFGDYGGVNVLGFDGMYGLGMTLDLFDVLYLRFGFHHFSGHWGDEMMEKFREKNPTTGKLLEYTRNNSWLFDMSIEPVKYFRLLAEVELPLRTAWIRPSAHVPQGTTTPGYGDSQVEHIQKQEGVKRVSAYPDSYKAWRIALGVEAQYPITHVGNVFVSYDFSMHQDGQVDLATLTYDETKPWEREYTVSAGIEFEERKDAPSFSLEVSWHLGRFPLLNYFFQKTQYIGVGITASL